ncbi:BTB/POZ domain-containing protein [Ditylenchus destructor]|nr:BTB/POZ domain-containing protein [Ditylenchus destructor]
MGRTLDICRVVVHCERKEHATFFPFYGCEVNSDTVEGALNSIIAEVDTIVSGLATLLLYYHFYFTATSLRIMNRLVRLKISGEIFETTKDTLSRCPGSVLARLANGDLSRETDESGVYCFEKDPKYFRIILNYLRRGFLNLDDKNLTMQGLLSEAEFFNIQPLIDEVRKAISSASNRSEIIMIYVEYINRRRSSSYIICSEEQDDYEVLRALRDKYTLQGNNGKYTFECSQLIIQIDIEIILRSFGFTQQYFDDDYREDDGSGLKCWKFVRTVSK